jgi:archaellum biogenesis ATPase FlaH
MGGLVLIGGTSGGGKSIYTLQQLMYSFSVDKIPTCLLNMELGLDETIARMYSQATGKEFSEIYGNTSPSVIASVNSWKQKYFTGDVEFRIKSIRYSVSEIEHTIRTQAAQGIVLFGIDYLQITDMETSSEEWKQLSNLVRLLHQLTQELQIVIISPVQINFSDTKVKDNELQVTIRGSRELEFSSSVFLFIYQTQEEYKENVARVFTIKARNAKKQIYMLQTDFSRMAFIDTKIIL